MGYQNLNPFLSDAPKNLEVEVTTLFFEVDHIPIHSHENQFFLDRDGFDNFEQMVSFLLEHIK
jgi:hypothetical protein